MDSIATLLGLRGAGPLSPPPHYSPYYLTWNFIFAFAIISSRPWKLYHKIDHQVSPREDLTKYGPTAVAQGKLTQKQLDRMKRVEGAHANSVEHFPLLAAAIVLAHVAKVPAGDINATALAYTLTRIAYAVNYITAETRRVSALRALLWWTSSIICFRLLFQSARFLNGQMA